MESLVVDARSHRLGLVSLKIHALILSETNVVDPQIRIGLLDVLQLSLVEALLLEVWKAAHRCRQCNLVKTLVALHFLHGAFLNLLKLTLQFPLLH